MKKQEKARDLRRRKPSQATLEQLASNVKYQRARLEISQEYLADQAGVNRTYVSALERCEINPTLASLEGLAEACQVGIADLFLPPQQSRKRK